MKKFALLALVGAALFATNGAAPAQYYGPEATMNGVMIGNGTVITTAGIMITTAGIIAKPGHVARATPCRMASANHTVDIRAH